MHRKPTPAERIAWHVAHAENCACRSIDGGVLKLFADHGIAVPKPRAS